MARKDDAFKVVVRPLYDDAERAADDGPRQCARDYRAVKLQQVGRDDHRDRALAVFFYSLQPIAASANFMFGAMFLVL